MLDFPSHRLCVPETTKNRNKSTRINFSLNNSIAGSNINHPPIALHININNSILNTTHATIAPPASLSKKLQTRVMAHLQRGLKKAQPITERSLEPQKSKVEITPREELQSCVLTPKEVLQKYKDKLTDYEKGEILDYQHIYFLGNSAKKHGPAPVFSDPKGYYNIILKDHIAYRYEILQYIGKGSFGQALKCFDHKEKTFVALKILRSKKKLYHQGMVEAKILKFIKLHDPEGKTHIVKMLEYFVFRKHIIITFELLSINLYNFLRNNNFNGISLGLIKRFALQLLDALAFLRTHQIIHCDLKPENILLEQPNRSAIKLIDFGSSCFSHERIYTYIQSRFYRAPEIMLGIPYTTGIDMWSLGCILAELFTGYPLFPGENEPEQMSMILEINGLPPKEMLEKASRRDVFFDEDGAPFLVRNSQGKIRMPGTKSIADFIKCPDMDFIGFIRNCLIWDPEKRMTPENAKYHPWITKTMDGGPSIAFNPPKVVSKRGNIVLNETVDKTNNTSVNNKTLKGLNASLSGIKMSLNGSFASSNNTLNTQRNENELAYKVNLRNKLNIVKEKFKHLSQGAAVAKAYNSSNHKDKKKQNLFLHVISKDNCLPPIQDGLSPKSNRSMKPLLNKLLS